MAKIIGLSTPLFIIFVVVGLFLGLPVLFGRFKKRKQEDEVDESPRVECSTAEYICANYQNMDTPFIIDMLYLMHDCSSLPLSYSTPGGSDLNEVMFYLFAAEELDEKSVGRLSKMLSWREIKDNRYIVFRSLLLVGLASYNYDFLLPIFIKQECFVRQILEMYRSGVWKEGYIGDYRLPEEVRHFVDRFDQQTPFKG